MRHYFFKIDLIQFSVISVKIKVEVGSAWNVCRVLAAPEKCPDVWDEFGGFEPWDTRRQAPQAEGCDHDSTDHFCQDGEL